MHLIQIILDGRRRYRLHNIDGQIISPVQTGETVAIEKTLETILRADHFHVLDYIPEEKIPEDAVAYLVEVNNNGPIDPEKISLDDTVTYKVSFYSGFGEEEQYHPVKASAAAPR